MTQWKTFRERNMASDIVQNLYDTSVSLKTQLLSGKDREI